MILGFSACLGRAEVDHASLWKAYAGRFLSQDGRVIDPQGGDRTTSEGQSYALFFALVNNEPARFETILHWTQTNLAFGDLGTHLPAWSWGKAKDGQWKVLDANSAADSDMWIAYDLLEAGRLWREPRYTGLGRKLAAQIARREVVMIPGVGFMLSPGSIGFNFPNGWVFNPSYLPVFVLDRLAANDPAGPWVGIAVNVPQLVAMSSRGGFAMDWVSYSRATGYAPSLATAPKSEGALGSYDAIRVYLWAGMLDGAHPAKGRLMESLFGMGTYLRQHGAPPEKVNAAGMPGKQDAPVGFSAAVLPYLRSIPDDGAATRQWARVESQVDEKTGLYGPSPTYYDENLTLFATGWLQKRFQFGVNGQVLVPWGHP
jgi:endoglucanase